MNETLFADVYIRNNLSAVPDAEDLLIKSIATWALFYRFALPVIDFRVTYGSIEGSVVGRINCIADICSIIVDPDYYQYETVMQHEVGHAYYFHLGGSNPVAAVLPENPPSAGVFAGGHWRNLDNDVMAAQLQHDPSFSDVTILALASHLSETTLCGTDHTLCRDHEVCHRRVRNAPGICTFMDSEYGYINHSDGDYFHLIPIIGFFVLCIIFLKVDSDRKYNILAEQNKNAAPPMY